MKTGWVALSTLFLLVTVVFSMAGIHPEASETMPRFVVGAQGNSGALLASNSPLTLGHCYDDSIQASVQESAPVDSCEDAPEDAYINSVKTNTPLIEFKAQLPRLGSLSGHFAEIDHGPPRCS